MVAVACSGGGDDPPDETPATGNEDRFDAGAELGGAAGDEAGASGSRASGTSGTSSEASSDQGESGAGCTGGSGEAPSPGEAGVASVGDLDADGRDDQAWVGPGPGEFGIVTAAGGVAPATSSLPSPSLAVLVADADQQAPVEVFVSDGTTAELWGYVACALEPVIGPDGAPWLFDLGERGNGTGVGCVDIEGERQLVGLNVRADDGTTVSWKRTIIELDGLSATIGASDTGTFTRPDDNDQIDLLHTITCHDLTIADDGISAG
jgi:hypothetical protein